MGLPLSLNFRGTTLFVGDGAGETAIPTESESTGTNGWAYPHTFSGLSMGWDPATGTAQFDRSNGTGAKFAGFASNNTGSANEFRVDLPEGSYKIAFAAGSYTALTWSATWTITFHDGTNATPLFTLNSIPDSGGNSFTDHNDALKTDSTWSNASPRSVSITAANGAGGTQPYLRINIGDGTNL